MSTFTTNKNLELPARGSDNNTWDVPVNGDFSTIDAAFGGFTAIFMTPLGAGTYTLSPSQYTPPNIIFTGAVNAVIVQSVPPGVGGLWSVWNNTTGNNTAYFGVNGSNYLVPQGQRVWLVSDGSNMQAAQTGGALSAPPSVKVTLSPISGTAYTYMSSDSSPALDQSIAPIWTGAHHFQNFVEFVAAFQIDNTMLMNGGSVINGTSGTILVQNQAAGDNSQHAASTAFVATSFAPLANAALTGSPSAPNAATVTSNTQIANTAFVHNVVNLGLTLAQAGSTTTGSFKIGNLLCNYGQLTTPGSSPTTVTYTTAFSSGVFFCVPYLINANQTYFISSGFNSSLSNFQLNFGGAGQLVGYVAMGI